MNSWQGSFSFLKKLHSNNSKDLYSISLLTQSRFWSCLYHYYCKGCKDFYHRLKFSLSPSAFQSKVLKLDSFLRLIVFETIIWISYPAKSWFSALRQENLESLDQSPSLNSLEGSRFQAQGVFIKDRGSLSRLRRVDRGEQDALNLRWEKRMTQVLTFILQVEGQLI